MRQPQVPNSYRSSRAAASRGRCTLLPGGCVARDGGAVALDGGRLDAGPVPDVVARPLGDGREVPPDFVPIAHARWFFGPRSSSSVLKPLGGKRILERQWSLATSANRSPIESSEHAGSRPAAPPARPGRRSAAVVPACLVTGLEAAGVVALSCWDLSLCQHRVAASSSTAGLMPKPLRQMDA
jgi:hypothetical protein